MTASRAWQDWTVDVHVLVRARHHLDDVVGLVLDRMRDVERVASRFRRDSEVMQLQPGPQRISPLLAELVSTALHVAAQTGGVVDPTLGRQLVALGYDRSLPDLPQDGPAAVVLPPVSSWRDVVLDGDRLELPPLVQLDLGATAKAWLVDDVIHQCAAAGIEACVNVGGDLAVAGPPWPVAVGDPDGPVHVVDVPQALATSSTGRRRWRRGTEGWHHVLDPRTGRSAPDYWRTVSVAAPTCVAANAASTAAIVLGPAAPAWLAARGLPARLVSPAGVVALPPWPEELAA